MGDFGVDVRIRGATAVLHLRGDLDGLAGPALTAAYDDATVTPMEAVVLNVGEVGYINSTGIALIVGMLAKARTAAIAVRVVGLNDHYRHIFEITRLADFMSFYGSEEEAVAEGTAAPA